MLGFGVDIPQPPHSLAAQGPLEDQGPLDQGVNRQRNVRMQCSEKNPKRNSCTAGVDLGSLCTANSPARDRGGCQNRGKQGYDSTFC